MSDLNITENAKINNKLDQLRQNNKRNYSKIFKILKYRFILTWILSWIICPHCF
jgi:hypothetical protein